MERREDDAVSREQYRRLLALQRQQAAPLGPDEYDEFDAWAGRQRPQTQGVMFRPLRS